MANDATNKNASNSDSSETSVLSATGDQQKVPPLRIVLNSTSNQKTSSSTIVNQQTTKKEKTQDARVNTALKGGGRIRIKLGTNKPSGRAIEQSETLNKRNIDTGTNKVREKNNLGLHDKQEENINEDSTSNFSHLRRITRRSHRAIQSISNEDDESISSMTSVDENLNTNTTQTNSDITQDPEQSDPASSTSAAGLTTNNATNGSSNTDTPRRCKRRKLESSESQSFDCDNLIGSQNYKLPHQNSFELFKNIRKQVDKRLEGLSSVQPKAPFGLRDFMLTRGAYLLDGNKLGNGTSLFMNEDGGLHTAPLGKYHVMRSNRTTYSVPNKARVPMGIPASSPLFDLFIEQEKERYRMRIQHIKEREKLTLAAEQEFVRAYCQAALAAANQDEPFSVCTMLKHQEIYNYLDSDGTTILSQEDAQQDQINQPDGVRTRRRQHGPTSPGPVRKGSGVDGASIEAIKKEIEISNTVADDKKVGTNLEKRELDVGLKTESQDCKKDDDIKTEQSLITEAAEGEAITKTTADEAHHDERASHGIPTRKISKNENDESSNANVERDASPTEEQIHERKAQTSGSAGHITPVSGQSELSEAKNTIESASKTEAASVSAEDESGSMSQPISVDSNPVISDEERRAANRETFLAQLQIIDDKWDKIRQEMLIRHRNEAESLHAIQKLDWEWKSKETGVCDVRTTLVIDNTLVPKLDVFTLDY